MPALLDRLQQALGNSYRLERELGGGGMSHVFVAEETALGRRVVVKVLPPDLAAGVSADRFRREIQLAAGLQHPGIVPVLSAGAQDDLLWYVMPYVEGESLRVRLARGAMPIDDAVRVWRDLLEALEYAHGRGIVHRDIKPENVMLTGRRAVTLDFGVAKAVSASTATGSGVTAMTGIGLAIGTPAYMAPEQAAGDGAVDGRADLYAAGLVLYEMLAGRGPFDARTPAEHMAAHIARVPESVAVRRPDIDASLAALVMQCLAKTPAERPASAAVAIGLLERVSTRGSVPPTRPSESSDESAGGVGARAAEIETQPRTQSTRRLVLGALVVTVVGVAGFLALRNRTPSNALPAAAVASLADSSRLQIAFLPVVAEAQDSVVARTLVSAQIQSLQSDRRVLLQTPDQIASIVASIDYPANASADSLKALYRDLGIHAYVVHTLVRSGSGLLLVAEGYASRNDSALFRVEAPASSAAELSAATGSIVSGTLAGALKAFGHVSPPLATGRLLGTTPEAARIWMESQEDFYRRDYFNFHKKIRVAVGLDSSFALAWSWMGVALLNANLSDAQRFDANRRASLLRAHIPSRPLRATAQAIHLMDLGELDSALAVLTDASKQFPDEWIVKNWIGFIYLRRRENELAAAAYRKLVENELETRRATVNIGAYGRALLQLGRVGEAQALSRRVDSLVGPKTVNAADLHYSIARATLDVEGMIQYGRDRIEMAASGPDRLPGYTALRDAMALTGRLDSARHLNAERDTIMRSQESGMISLEGAAHVAEWRATFLADSAVAIATLDSALTRWNWLALPALDRMYPDLIQARLAAGQLELARKSVDEWERSVPAAVMRTQLPLIQIARGEIALSSGNPGEALRRFRAGDVGLCETCVHPRVARAFDAMHLPDSTILWYERYLERPPFATDVDARELARAYRRLGELYEAKGDTKRALQRYSDFVELWKNADAPLQPAVKAVRERMARLQKAKG